MLVRQSQRSAHQLAMYDENITKTVF